MKMEKITLGILGGGQLGRMSALAAANLGIRTHIFCPEPDCPASQVTHHFTNADYNNFELLQLFASNVDYITYEFENIPIETVRFLRRFRPVFPDDHLLEVSQNRLKEKEFLNNIGIETAPWAPARAPEDILSVMDRWGVEKCIIKTTRYGYDGKGQIKHSYSDNILNSWSKLNTEEAIVEGIIDFAYEASIIVSRDHSGKSETFPMTINDHQNHILSKTVIPAPIPDDIQDRARQLGLKLAEAVNLRGLLALELFVTHEGKILANEIAPRTHNSGHWTMDGCSISQFEQHVRAVCGLPILRPVTTQSVTMINLIGADVKDVPGYLRMDNARVHLYGKEEARDGRKMGHVNLLKPISNS